MKSDIRQELLELQVLQGIDFVRQLKLIASRKEFRPLDTDPEIFLVGGKDDADFPWPVVHQELHDEVQAKIKSYR